jgi:hypothetical protein
MSQAEVTRDPAADPRERFVKRPPSQAWEAISAADYPPNTAWAWFKPPAIPNGMILRLAAEAFQPAAPTALWTMRRLLWAAEVDPAVVVMWRVNGAAFPAAGGTNPLLDLPVPAPVPGADPNIAVTVALPLLHGAFPPQGFVPAAHPAANGQNGSPIPAIAGFPPQPQIAGMPASPIPIPPMAVATVGGPAMPGVPLPGMPMPAAIAPGAIAPPSGPPASGHRKHEPIIPAPAHLLEAYEHVEQDWRSSQETEKDLARLRQQLLDMMGRLKALNRDLTGPERVHSNNQEKKDWLHARRMLRDCTNRLWKCVKAHDIGYTSSAGQRRWFEDTYDKYIAPRRHFEGFADADRAFGSYRKIVTNLHIEMSNALSIAQLDGERRAQQILARIAEKIREAGNRKNFLGVILD